MGDTMGAGSDTVPHEHVPQYSEFMSTFFQVSD